MLFLWSFVSRMKRWLENICQIKNLLMKLEDPVQAKMSDRGLKLNFSCKYKHKLNKNTMKIQLQIQIQIQIILWGDLRNWEFQAKMPDRSLKGNFIYKEAANLYELWRSHNEASWYTWYTSYMVVPLVHLINLANQNLPDTCYVSHIWCLEGVLVGSPGGNWVH